MEAFLSNLPPHLTDRTLEKQLRPYMNTLGIFEWSCYSSRGKNLGWVTFLYPEDGNKFLARHGKQSLPNQPISSQPLDSRLNAARGAFSKKKGSRDRANLHLMNVPVFVSKSHKPPDPFHIRSLHHRLQEKSKQRTQHDAPGVNDDAISFTVMSLRCGHNSFRNPSQALTFVQECRMELSGYAKFGKKLLVLKYGTSVKIEIPYASIVQMIHKSSPCTFTLVLTEPPRFYHLPNDLDELNRMMGQLGISSQGASSPQQFFRGTSIVSYPNHAKFAGKCLVYQFYVNDPDFDHKMITLERRSLFEIAHFNIAHDERPNLWELDYTTSWDLFYGHLSNAGQNNALPFRILFLVQSLVWNNYLHPRVADDLLLKIQVLFKEAKASSQPEPISEQAIKNLRDGPRDSLPFPVHGTEPHMLDSREILDYLLEVEARIRNEADYRGTLFGPQVANHHAWIFRAMVTPTRVTLHGPELEPLNRILRKYPNHTDYFMRVQFCDEDGGDLFVTPRASLDQIFHRYREILKNGISVAGRIYQFLGFSHSSLRSHAAWFLAPFMFNNELQLYQNIIKSLGDFEHIQIPAKCAARIGQAFSETPSFVALEETGIQWRNIPDVKKQDGDIQRVFSDGVGTISQEAIELIWPRLLQGSSIPTCLQIRWGGVKGMLSLDTRLRGRLMCIRTESMEKFPSRDKHNLEICDAASRPLRLVLNRQMIKIMEDLGVDNSFFLRLQKIELDRLRAVTADAYNTGTFLHMQGIGLNCFLPTFIKALDKYGIDYRQDDFLRIVVESVVLRELRLLKHKARIPVSKGVTLFGIMDETGFLREGEVYVCYDSYRRHGNVAIENTLRDGLVVVTRSPALHPGDIQVVRMRTPPVGHPLRSLRNCIAFSQFGKRDLPSQLSGGDLDGDLYNIIWDRAAIPKRVYTAADYPRVTPQPLGRQVERDDMAGWFVDFMKSDVLGMIATRHLILSDQDSQGTVGVDCITLSSLHSTAVDFSKTGIPVNQKEIPKAPRFRPDFLAPAPPAHLYDRHQIDFIGRDDAEAEDDEDMAGPNHHYYKSVKILGTLYRNVDEKQIWDEDISRVVSKRGPSVWDQFVGLMERKIEDYTHGSVSWKTRRADAKRLRDVYEDTVMGAMNQYSDNFMLPLTEVEVFCGSIFNKSGSQTRRQKDNSKKLKAEFDRLSEWLVMQMRRKHRPVENGEYGTTGYSSNAAPSQADTEGDPASRVPIANREALEMSYACLMVGLVQNHDADYEHRADLHSFKVIAASVLLKELTELANRARGGQMVAPTNADDGDVGGGGYVGVSSGPGAAYAYNGYDVDVGQYPNYGYTQYI